MLVAAPAASAVELALEVDNPRAPRVELLEPADGAVVPAGRPVRVRATSADAELLWVALDGSVTWVVDQAAMEAVWRPDPGRHVLVVGAEMTGMPGALDDATITVQAAVPDGPADPDRGGALPGPGAGPAAPPPAPAPAPATAPGAGPPGAGAPGATGPGTVTPASPSATTVPAAGRDRVTAPRRRAGGVPAVGRPGRAGGPTPGATGRRVPPDAGAPAQPALLSGGPRIVEAGPDDGWNPLHGGRRGLIAAGLPVLLLAALVAYALVQRYVDGGRKLAWRGRHEPDDVIVEF